MDAKNSNRQELRKFGLAFSAAILIVPGVFCWVFVQPYPWQVTAPAAAFLSLLAAFQPRAVKWIRALWMAFAGIVAWINTRLLLGAFFYLCFSPLAWLVRKSRHPLELERQDCESYYVRAPVKKSDMRKTY